MAVLPSNQDPFGDRVFGARWNGTDLHLHSPGVESFSFPSGGDSDSAKGIAATAATYADKLASVGITVAALTDYNGIRVPWYRALGDACEKRGVVLLPGAELSFSVGRHGLHVLAVFGRETDLGEVNRFINALDVDPGRLLFEGRTTRDISPQTNVAQSLTELRDRFECLLIFAHPDERNGLCRSLQPKDAAELLQTVRPDALDHCPRAALDGLLSTHVVSKALIERLALVEFSDPKSVEDIGSKSTSSGSRRTWLKLSSFDVGALRIALHDPEVRVRTIAPDAENHGRIVGIRVEGSGFLGSIEMGLNPDLNTVIGGRGSGKSAIIESIRYALDIQPYSEQTYRDELIRYGLGSGGRISVVLERTLEGRKTQRYRVDRVLGEPPRVTDLVTRSQVDVAPAQVLGPMGPPAVFGQREIYAVATNDAYRLRLLDEIIGDEADAAERQVRDSTEELERNATELMDATRQLGRRDEFEQRLKTLNAEIEIYERFGVADRLRQATDLRADSQVLQRLQRDLLVIRAGVGAEPNSTVNLLESGERALKTARSEGKSILERAVVVVRKLHADVLAGLAQVARTVDAATVEIEKLQAEFKVLAQPVEARLDEIKRQLHSDALDPDRLLALSEQRNAIGPVLQEFERVARKVESLRTRRSNLLEGLRESRLAVHRLRREACDRITRELAGTLKLSVAFKGQQTDFARRLAARLRGSGVSTEAIERIASTEATDGASVVAAVREGAQAIRTRYGLTQGMSERLVGWLTQDETRLLQLEAEHADDAVLVELRIGPDEYRPLTRLSVGQRSTAILLLLLARFTRPLVLDQPEDDLDNRFIYDDIVRILRRLKGQRQLIVATHNANIPVLGDAELIAPLEAVDGHARLAACASIDVPEVRETVKQVMEGGEEAFRRRAEKYGTAG